MIFAGNSFGQVDEATHYLEHSASLLGPTGWINIPAASVPDDGKMTAAIHRGYAKLNFGLWGILEAGVFFEADKLGKQFEPYRNLADWELVEENAPAFIKEAFKGHGKVRLIDQKWGFVSLAVGMERQDYYVVAQKHLAGLSKVTLMGGWGTGRFNKGFFGLSKTVFSGAELSFEFDGEGINVGYRLLLGPNLIMDLAGQQLNTIGEVQNLGEVISNHLVFGITYVETVW